MEKDFIDILQEFIAEQGKEALFNASKYKGLLADHTKNEYKKESRLLLQALDAGVQKAIDTTKELAICKKQQVRLLHEEYGLDEKAVADIVDALALVLRGDTTRTEIENTNSANEKAQAAYERGKKYGDNNDYVNAIKEFTEAIKLDPNYVKAYVGRGKTYQLMRQSENAIKEFDEAIRRDPNYAPAYARRGKLNFLEGHDDEAISDCTKAISLDPKNADAYSVRGSASFAKGQVNEAISNFNEAIRLDPKNAMFFVFRGQAYLMKGQSLDYFEAIKDCDKAINLDSSIYVAYLTRADAFSRIGASKEAIKDLEKVLSLEPNFEHAKIMLRAIRGY